VILSRTGSRSYEWGLGHKVENDEEEREPQFEWECKEGGC